MRTETGKRFSDIKIRQENLENREFELASQKVFVDSQEEYCLDYHSQLGFLFNESNEQFNFFQVDLDAYERERQFLLNNFEEERERILSELQLLEEEQIRLNKEKRTL